MVLVMMTVSAVVFAIAYSADQGGIYAMGATTGVGFLIVVFVVSALTFLVAWAMAVVPQTLGLVLLLGGFLLFILNLISPRVANIWLLDAMFVGAAMMVIRGWKGTSEHSPFARDELPPQHLAPRDPSL